MGAVREFTEEARTRLNQALADTVEATSALAAVNNLDGFLVDAGIGLNVDEHLANVRTYYNAVADQATATMAETAVLFEAVGRIDDEYRSKLSIQMEAVKNLDFAVTSLTALLNPSATGRIPITLPSVEFKDMLAAIITDLVVDSHGASASATQSEPDPGYTWSDDETVSEMEFTDEMLDPSRHKQNQVGDCWLISTINSIVETPEGREFIRDSIHWDEDANGYQVRLFVNGKEKWVLVTQTVQQGAYTTDGKLSVIELYESAILTEYGGPFLNGNAPAEAAEVVAGEHTQDYIRVDLGFIDIDISDDAIASGGAIDGGVSVASTPDDFDGQSTKTGVQATPDPTGGKTVSITIAADHAYEVVSVVDGMIGLRNPWGLGNQFDSVACNSDGVFFISAEDFNALFTSQTQTEFTGLT